jgi:hypothetical protein
MIWRWILNSLAEPLLNIGHMNKTGFNMSPVSDATRPIKIITFFCQCSKFTSIVDLGIDVCSRNWNEPEFVDQWMDVRKLSAQIAGPE